MEKRELAFVAVCIAYLGLHFVAAIFPGYYLWGFDSWQYLGIIPSILLLTVGILVSFERINPRIDKISRKLFSNLIKLPFIVWLLIIGALLFLLREKTFFLGDGYFRISETKNGVLFFAAEPLDAFIHSFLYKILNPPTGISAEDIYAYISILSGLAAIAGVRYYLRKMVQVRYDRFRINLLIFCGGYLQLFAGYAESYSILAASLVILLISGLHMLRSGRYSIVPALMFTLSVLLHPMTLILFPALAYAYYKITKQSETPQVKYWLLPLVIFAGSYALLVLGFWARGFDPAKLIKVFFGESHILPLLSSANLYGIISLPHLNDVINLLALGMPILVSLPYASENLKKHFGDRYVIFVTISATMLFLFLVLFKPALGFARDWDIFSLSTIPLSVLTAILLYRNKQYFEKYSSAIIIICFLHTLPWIWLNAGEDRSYARAEKLAGTNYWTDAARGQLYIELSNRYFAKGLPEKAFDFLKLAYKYEKNPNYLKPASELSYKLGKFNDAVFYLNEMLVKYPDTTFITSYLPDAYLQLKMPDSAIAYLNSATAARPNDDRLLVRLGAVYMSVSNTAQAEGFFKKASEINPENIDALNYLAYIYYSGKNFTKAAEMYESILEKYPGNPNIHANIALIYNKLGNDSAVASHLDYAAKNGLNPQVLAELKKQIESDKITK